MVSRFISMKNNIRFSKHKSWGICASYSDGTLTVCRYGKTKQEAENKVLNRVSEYYEKS